MVSVIIVIHLVYRLDIKCVIVTLLFRAAAWTPVPGAGEFLTSTTGIACSGVVGHIGNSITTGQDSRNNLAVVQGYADGAQVCSRGNKKPELVALRRLSVS